MHKSTARAKALGPLFPGNLYWQKLCLGEMGSGDDPNAQSASEWTADHSKGQLEALSKVSNSLRSYN